MKLFGLLSLLCLGLIEIIYGLFWGRMKIYAVEGPMHQSLGINPDHDKFFVDYIRVLKDQWGVVAWFGAITVLIAVVGLVLLHKYKTAHDKQVSR